MLKSGDIEMLGVEETWGKGENNQSIRVMQAKFYVRKSGPYSVAIPKADFTAENLIKAITVVATQIADTLDFTG